HVTTRTPTLPPFPTRRSSDLHLDSNARAVVLQMIDFRQMADKVEASRIEEVRQTLAGLSSDSQRIDLLLQLSAAAEKKNAKLTRDRKSTRLNSSHQIISYAVF